MERTILAFLQNLWVKDPERTRVMLAKHDEEYRRQVIRQLLFAGGLTGQRLRAAFGDLCAQIVWEEASREIAGDAKAICTPDPVHIRAVLDQLQPSIVIAFGRVAGDAVLPFWPELIRLPHPAARQADVMEKLRQASCLLADAVLSQKTLTPIQDELLRKNIEMVKTRPNSE